MEKKVKIIPLGGLKEIGKNITVFETDTDMIIVDCGISFPDDTMLGVDLVIPDTTYVEEHADKLRGIFITHAHEDHIGGIPFLLKKVNVPVFGTKFTLGVLENKLVEHKVKSKTKCQVLSAGQSVKLGDFEVEFINTTHSIPGAVAVVIKTPCGTILHTGDFKIDMTPTYGYPIDLARFGEYGAEGVKLMLCESTNAERPGTTRSESEVEKTIDDIFMKYKEQRITVATFSSNVFRIQSVVKAAVKHGRKIALSGRSMLNISDVAMEQKILKIPSKNLIDIEEVNDYEDKKVCIITTGSQGEPMSVLYRMAFGEHKILSLDNNDVVVLSSHTIPGNEKLVNQILNKLAERDVTVICDSNTQLIHVSGHACQEELKILQSLVQPEYLMPIHGEPTHLKANKELAMKLGMSPENIIMGKNGCVVEMTEDEVVLTTNEVQTGRVFIDGSGIGDVGPVVLRDRQILSQDGIIVVVFTIDLDHKFVLAGPDIVARGFVYVKESDELMTKIRDIAKKEIAACMDENVTEWKKIKDRIRDAIAKFVYNKTKRNPMIVPILENV